MTRIVAAIITGLLSTFVAPAVAWAEQSGAADVVRRGPRVSFLGVASVLCCLVVVGGIVVVVLLLTRRKR